MEEGTEKTQERPEREYMGGGALAIIAVLAAALSVGITLLLVNVLGDDDSGELEPASRGDLREVSERLDRPVFWAGEQDGRKMELTVNDRGYVYVRYLPEDVELGDESAAYPTIATYPVENALAVTQQGDKRGRVEIKVPGGVGVYYRARPNSVFLTLGEADALIEIYHPDAKRARQLARSGRIKPVR